MAKSKKEPKPKSPRTGADKDPSEAPPREETGGAEAKLTERSVSAKATKSPRNDTARTAGAKTKDNVRTAPERGAKGGRRQVHESAARGRLPSDSEKREAFLAGREAPFTAKLYRPSRCEVAENPVVAVQL